MDDSLRLVPVAHSVEGYVVVHESSPLSRRYRVYDAVNSPRSLVSRERADFGFGETRFSEDAVLMFCWFEWAFDHDRRRRRECD